MTTIGTDVSRAAALLRAGELVAIPTETVYGLGADALNSTAVAKVFAAKSRPRFDPLIVHIPDASQLTELVTVVPDMAHELAAAFWPGPLTMVLPKRALVPDLVTSGLPTVAIRVPAHPLALELLRESGIPIAAPSANKFGCLSPTCAEHVASQLSENVDYILDGGPCAVGVESTVLQLPVHAGDKTLLLRPGGLSAEQIEAITGPVIVPDAANHPSTLAQTAPGMLPQHYAPDKPLLLVDDITSFQSTLAIGLLTLQPVTHSARFQAVEVLSESGDLTEAAANFFAALHRLEAADIEQIIATPFPNEGIGHAMNDRLARAAKK